MFGVRCIISESLYHCCDLIVFLQFSSQLKGMSGEAAQEEVKVMVDKLKLEDKRDAVVSRTKSSHLFPSLS